MRPNRRKFFIEAGFFKVLNAGVGELGNGALVEPIRLEKMPFVSLDTRLAQCVAVCSHAYPPDKNEFGALLRDALLLYSI